MSEEQAAAHENASEHGEHHDHTKHYLKIYGALLVLAFISFLGPEVGPTIGEMLGQPGIGRAIVLFTAFGIALVKAYLVASEFMHLKMEKKYISYLMFTSLAFMLLFFAAVAPDVLNHQGAIHEIETAEGIITIPQWENIAAKAEIQRVLEQSGAAGNH